MVNRTIARTGIIVNGLPPRSALPMVDLYIISAMKGETKQYARVVEANFVIWAATSANAATFNTFASAKDALKQARTRGKIELRSIPRESIPLPSAPATPINDIVDLKSNAPRNTELESLPPVITEREYDPEIPAWMRDFHIFTPFNAEDTELDPGPLPMEF